MKNKLWIGGFIIAVICIAGYIWSQRIQKEVEMTEEQYDYYKSYCLTVEDITRKDILDISTEVGTHQNPQKRSRHKPPSPYPQSPTVLELPSHPH